MRTIRENAEKIMKQNMDYANGQISVGSNGKDGGKAEQYTLRSYIEYEAKANPNFFRWLFNDYDIVFFGKNLSEERLNEYKAWLNDL